MKRELAAPLFSYLFLFIFLVKMVISVAPLIANHMDSRFVNAVIMQLELENHSSKGSDQAKDSLNKGEWLSGLYRFNFCHPAKVIVFQQYALTENCQIQAFYPSVPTPPPNC